jgi:shikimate kinase
MNIILIGFMGTGKTTVGKLLSAKTGMPFADADDWIVQAAGMTIPDIFNLKGESYFRSLEAEILRKAADMPWKVISTGGGAVLNPDNFALLKRSGCTIGLLATLETLWQRLQSDTSRPLLRGPDPKSQMAALYHARIHLYQQAEYTVWVDGKSPLQITQEILALPALKPLMRRRNDE